jgi:hypothetical protein
MKKIIVISILFLTFICFILLNQYQKDKARQERKIVNLEKEISNSKKSELLSLKLFAKYQFDELKNKYNKYEIKEKKETYLIEEYILPTLPSRKSPMFKNITSPNGFIEIYNEFIIYITGKGELFKLSTDNEKVKLDKISTNINSFFPSNFKETNDLSITDILYDNKKFYIAYTNKVPKGCYNISILEGDFKKSNLVFEEFYTFNDCYMSNLNVARQSGGALAKIEDYLMVSLGDWVSFEQPQDKNRLFGKISKINIKTKEMDIISMGHRNPQGLDAIKDKNNNILIFSTEHGAKGGDEVNLQIYDTLSKKKEIVNFGWPLASDGAHYSNTHKSIKEKFPLPKSHSDNNLKKPLISYVPSAAPSKIIIRQNPNDDDKLYLIISTMGKKNDTRPFTNSILFYEYNIDSKKIDLLNNIKLGGRIRDIKFKNQNFIAINESAPSFISIKKIKN